jgi:acetate kinase
MSQDILVLNPGSSTLKFGLYRLPEGGAASTPEAVTLLAGGMVDRMGSPEAQLQLDAPGQPTRQERIQAASPAKAVETVLRSLNAQAREKGKGKREKNLPLTPACIGCRVVHGGARFVAPTRVTPEVLEGIRALSPLAPLHNPVAADVLAACLRLLPDIPTVAVFDTAFHRTLPPVARTYALPFSLCEQHQLYRYGFHGIAHRYVSARLIACLDKVGQESRCITCHLGNGASVCAVRDGHSLDTSMGLTPMEGLVMGTRSGDVDPGLLLYLLRTVGLSPEVLDDLLNHQSGLLGLSGRSADMRDLEKAAAEGDARSELALEVFAYRAAKTIGAYAVALEGLDGLAFSGGIGEHSAAMRQRICGTLRVLGVVLNAERNRVSGPQEPVRISADESSVQVYVIPANEDAQIASEVSGFLLPSPAAWERGRG